MKKIIGIGNAIVDLICLIEDEFLSENLLVKNSMSLIDNDAAQKLSQLKAHKITSGGSVANSIATIAQLGGNAAFIGKVSLDEFGRKFITEIEKNGVNFVSKTFSHHPTARSFVLVTPDAHRTMCTFLGCASEISENDFSEELFQGASILYLEGYLWDKPQVISALKKAIALAKRQKIKIAFTLSDLFCAARHKEDFIDLISSDLDILFCNEGEIKELLNLDNIDSDGFAALQEFFNINKKLTAIVTRSEKGCVVFAHNQITIFDAEEIDELVDTTGAGDAFAAGFLLGCLKDFSLEKSAQTGNLLASKIIQKIGARFNEQEIEKLL